MKRLLLVEENPGTHDIFQELLYDWFVMPAFSPKQAEQILAEEQDLEELVLMVDADLIRDMAADWLNRIRTGYPEVPVVVLSGEENEEAVERWYDFGAKAAMSRPFYESELRDALKKCRGGAEGEETDRQG